jgi:hypothetical protein
MPYEALSVFDDSRDDRVAGDELQRIAEWIDCKGEGVCLPGEVWELGGAGIEFFGVRSTLDADGTLMHEMGMGTSSDVAQASPIEE